MFSVSKQPKLSKANPCCILRHPWLCYPFSFAIIMTLAPGWLPHLSMIPDSIFAATYTKLSIILLEEPAE